MGVCAVYVGNSVYEENDNRDILAYPGKFIENESNPSKEHSS